MFARGGRLLRLWIIPSVAVGFLLIFGAANCLVPLRAQTASTGSSPTSSVAASAPSTNQPAPSNASEMTTHDVPVPLTVRVNVVPLRVIVRDQNGNTVANLQRENFQLFEDGKPQPISNFTVETLDSISKHVVQASPAQPAGVAPPNGSAFLPPSRFIVLLFDDSRTTRQDLMAARDAASHYVDASLAPTDRVAVYTISGQFQLDFTDDRAKLHQALLELQPREVTAEEMDPENDCPPMEFYEAYQIEIMHDQTAMSIATTDALNCQASASTLTNGPSPSDIARAQATATAAALRVFEADNEKTEFSFRSLRAIIQRLSAMPGQRDIVLISPGFIYPTLEYEFSEIVDRAIRAGVFINTLDARGLYVPQLGPDISQQTNDPTPQAAGYRTLYRTTGQESQIEVLLDLARDTGGRAFNGSNDLRAGIQEIAAAPAAYYVLGFSPSNLKFDGHFHSLKVVVTGSSKEKFSVQARRGFYAPKHSDTPADAASQDIEDAVFSQEEQHGLPISLQTQYFKTGATDAKLAVMARVDLSELRFNKADGRNRNNLTVVAALFDRNGNFITGSQKILEMNLRDQTLERIGHSGVVVRSSFDVKPGDYVVRLVVRDSTAALLSAENGVVEIPY